MGEVVRDDRVLAAVAAQLLQQRDGFAEAAPRDAQARAPERPFALVERQARRGAYVFLGLLVLPAGQRRFAGVGEQGRVVGVLFEVACQALQAHRGRGWSGWMHGLARFATERPLDEPRAAASRRWHRVFVRHIHLRTAAARPDTAPDKIARRCGAPALPSLSPTRKPFVKTAASAIDIRPASVADVPLILGFIRELAIYEKAEHEVTATEAQIRQSLFGDAPRARALVCRVGGVDCGFALYFFNYSTWQGRQGLYLEDLYVSPSHRHAGAGKAMLQHLARIAVANDCGRFEWSVLDWNEPAIRFYRSIGAVAMDEWVRYRLTGPALADFARGAQPAA
jgi:GNAT superfamily N-acetyltransferase